MLTGNIFNKMSTKVKARESSPNLVHLSPGGERARRQRANGKTKLSALPEVRDLNVYQSGLDL